MLREAHKVAHIPVPRRPLRVAIFADCGRLPRQPREKKHVNRASREQLMTTKGCLTKNGRGIQPAHILKMDLQVSMLTRADRHERHSREAGARTHQRLGDESSWAGVE
jgi:hypothetical protein